MLKHKQSGNVLFLILVAVALFAALSYAISQSSRLGGGNANKEKVRADAAAIIQYTATLRSAVMRLRANGCSEEQLDFQNTIFQRNNGTAIDAANSNTPSDGRCRLFSPSGGGVVPVVAPVSALEPPSATPGNWKPGHYGLSVYQMKNIGTDGAAGTVSANDLLYQINMIKKETCMAINDLLGINNPSGDAPARNLTGTVEQFINGSFASNAIATGPDVDGKTEFCYKGTNYYYTSVLISR